MAGAECKGSSGRCACGGGCGASRAEGVVESGQDASNGPSALLRPAAGLRFAVAAGLPGAADGVLRRPAPARPALGGRGAGGHRRRAEAPV